MTVALSIQLFKRSVLSSLLSSASQRLSTVMVKVDFGSGIDIEEIRNCTTQPECETPKVTMYPSAPVCTLTTESSSKNEHIAYQYFEERGFTNQQMNELLAWVGEASSRC